MMAIAEAMQRVYTSLDDTLVYHTRTSNSSEVLNAIDIIAQVFQTHMPEQLHELLSGNITVAEFEAATSLEAMGLVYDADCAAIRCEAAGVYDAAVLQKQPAAATAPPSSGDDDNGAMSNGTIAGIAVAMLLLGACCGGAIIHAVKSHDLCAGEEINLERMKSRVKEVPKSQAKELKIQIPSASKSPPASITGPCVKAWVWWRVSRPLTSL